MDPSKEGGELSNGNNRKEEEEMTVSEVAPSNQGKNGSNRRKKKGQSVDRRWILVKKGEKRNNRKEKGESGHNRRKKKGHTSIEGGNGKKKGQSVDGESGGRTSARTDSIPEAIRTMAHVRAACKCTQTVGTDGRNSHLGVE